MIQGKPKKSDYSQQLLLDAGDGYLSGLTCAHGELTAHRFEGAEVRSLGARVRRLLLAREQGHGTGWTGTVCVLDTGIWNQD